MHAYNKKRFDFFIAILASVFLLAAISAKHHFSQKKQLTCKDNNVEASVTPEAEEGNDNEQPFHLALSPGGFIYLERKAEVKSPEFSCTGHTRKMLSEARLYILFLHLKSHIA
ncbi:MAG: hypothetical protein K8F30_01320 [Taibaiella sp.]|nr:hypothetical protein [Taibaiella sp.]